MNKLGVSYNLFTGIELLEHSIKCIKKAYNLSNELNKTNMLVVTKPME